MHIAMSVAFDAAETTKLQYKYLHATEAVNEEIGWLYLTAGVCTRV